MIEELSPQDGLTDVAILFHEKVSKWFDILTEDKIWFQFSLEDGKVCDFADQKLKAFYKGKALKKGDKIKMEVDPLHSECRIYVNNKDIGIAFANHKLKESIMMPVVWMKNPGASMSVLNPIIESDTVNHFFKEEIA